MSEKERERERERQRKKLLHGTIASGYRGNRWRRSSSSSRIASALRPQLSRLRLSMTFGDFNLDDLVLVHEMVVAWFYNFVPIILNDSNDPTAPERDCRSYPQLQLSRAMISSEFWDIFFPRLSL